MKASIALLALVLSAPAFAQSDSSAPTLAQIQYQQQLAQQEADRQQALYLQQQQVDLMRQQQLQQMQMQQPQLQMPDIAGSAMRGFQQGQEARLRQLEIERLQQQVQANGGQ